MKTTLLFLSLIGGSHLMAQGPTVSFEKSDTTLSCTPDTDNHYRFSVKVAAPGGTPGTISVEADLTKTELPSKDFQLTFPGAFTTNGTSTDASFFLTIKKDADLHDRKKIFLKIKIVDANGQPIGNASSAVNEMVVSLESDSRLNGYNYLAYAGTNFDLVDGVKAKNLFFATNIFLPPATSYKIHRPRLGKRGEDGDVQKWKKDSIRSIGVYLSLYGNRTFSSTDSLRDIYRLTGMSLVNDTTVAQYFERTTLARKRVSDNIGASFMPLFRMGRASDQNNAIKLYCGPSFDFIWRRIQMEYNYLDRTPSDTIFQSADEVPFSANYSAPSQLKTNYNEFDVNMGIGTMVTHETDQISIRITFSGGPQLHYTRESLYGNTSSDPSEALYRTQFDWYFCGRAWITDHTSGITLQAEVTNAFNNSRPYYGVTLSKAINYRRFGDFFQPLSSR